MLKLKKIASAVGAGALVLAAAPSFAAIDVTAVTTGISDAQTALLSVIGGLMALSVAIFGTVMVYRFVRKRAGS